MIDHIQATQLESMMDKLMQVSYHMSNKEEYRRAQALSNLVGELRVCSQLVANGLQAEALERWAAIITEGATS